MKTICSHCKKENELNANDMRQLRKTITVALIQRHGPSVDIVEAVEGNIMLAFTCKYCNHQYHVEIPAEMLVGYEE